LKGGFFLYISLQINTNSEIWPQSSHILVNYYIILFLIILSVPGSVSRQKGPAVSGGLVFSGNHQEPVGSFKRAPELPPGKATYLHITKDNLIELGPEYSVTFSASFRYNFTSGNILSIGNPAYKLDLRFNASPNSDSVFLNLLFNGEESVPRFVFAKEDIHEGKSFRIKLSVDGASGRLWLSINGMDKKSSMTPFPAEEPSEIFMGSPPGKNDCAPMTVQDLRISIAGELAHIYKFNETDGNIAYDSEGDLDARAINHEWLINRHYFWTVHDSITLNKSDYQGIFNDPYNNRFGILTGEGIEYYSFNHRNFKLSKYPEPDRTRFGMYAFPNQDLVVGYCSFWPDNEAVTYDFKNGRGTGKLTVDTKEGHHYGGRVFVDTRTGSVNIFGGYGWYKTRNQLYRFNRSSGKWDELKTKGDFISPRHNFAVLPSDEKDVYYIIGGAGNSSGNQADGFRNLWDIFRFNLDSLSFTRIFDWGKKENYHVNFRAVWADEGENTIYASLRPEGWGEGRSKIMGRIQLGDTVLAIVGDTGKTAGFYPAEGELVIDRETNRLYSVIPVEYDSTVTVRIHSINTPLLSDIEYKELHSNSPNVLAMNRSSNWSIWGIPLAALLLLPLASIYIRRYRRKKKIAGRDGLDKPVGEMLGADKKPESNLITIFGGLRINDESGFDITRKLTPKQYEILTLIALHTFNDKNLRGIELHRLDRVIWQGTPAENIKNTRKVTLSKIRATLKEYDGVSLTVNENKVSLRLDQRFRNEIESYFLLKRYFSDSDKINDVESITNFIRIVGRGKFMGALAEEWVDDLRPKEENEITAIITLYLKRIFEEGRLESCIGIIDTISVHDPLNEELLCIKLRSLYNLGRHSIALETYNSYRREYQTIFNTNYSTSLQDLLKS